MLKIEKFVTASPEQWEIIIEGMRNPKNSWDRMDSFGCRMSDSECHVNCTHTVDECPVYDDAPYFELGEKDHELMDTLNAGGPVHAKYRRMIPVWVTLTAPLYFWKEFDTYKVGTVCNSCSTMHKIHEKEFTLEDFSCEHLFPECPGLDSMDILQATIEHLNKYRQAYLNCAKKLKREDLTNAERKHVLAQQKLFWWQMIQLLPTSYNQKRTVMLNYEVLCNIYRWRKNHKLDEWHVFCDWIRELPYSELIIGEEEDND